MKTDKKIEEITKKYLITRRTGDDSTFDYSYEDINKELTNLLNTEVQKAVEDGVRGFYEYIMADERGDENFLLDEWLETYLQTLKDKK